MEYIKLKLQGQRVELVIEQAQLQVRGHLFVEIISLQKILYYEF